MLANINETAAKIRAVGPDKVRAVPMDGQNVYDGKYQIEIHESNGWNPIAACPNKTIADGIIAQAVNNVILG